MPNGFYLITFLMSLFIHYCVQKGFVHLNKFDDINHRSSHSTLATRTGGIGVFLVLFLTSLFFYFKNIELFDYTLFIPLGTIFLVGAYDDFYQANFKLKFLFQIIIAKILIDQGFVISNYYGFLGFETVPWLIAQLTTIFVYIVIVNSINFIDGIDGLAITETIKVFVLIEFFSNGFTNLFALGSIVFVSLIPLYYFNFKKSKKVFLGDGGSLFLGTFISIYIFYVLGEDYNFSQDLVMNKTFFSIMIMSYPLIDLLRVFILRVSKGKSPFSPDQNHIHHKVLKKKNHLIRLLAIQIAHLLLILVIFFLTKYGF